MQPGTELCISTNGIRLANTELEMAYCYKNELILQKKNIRSLQAPSAKKFKAVANSDHFPNITRKKTPSKIVDTDFPSLKSIIKAPTNDTNYTSAALHYKRVLLKSPITPTKNKEYHIVGATNITSNDGTNEQLCQGGNTGQLQQT